MGSNWDWQVFLQDPGGKYTTYWEWMLSAWGWTVSVALLALIVALVLGSLVGFLVAFVHAQLRLLSGRDAETKRDLTGRIADVLRRHAPRPAGVLVQLSVEIVDMDRPSYVKERLV